MGKCKYCGENAGLFHSSHPECEQRHTSGLQKVTDLLTECFHRREDFYLRRNELERILSESYISPEEKDAIYLDTLDRAVDKYLDDGIIDAAEERTVARFMQFTGMPQQTLNSRGALEKVVQSKVLQEILNGQTPAPRITVAGNFPFLLSRDESLIWLFRNVTLQVEKTRRETVGRTRGVSVRICRGVYYRTGGFRGTPVETTYMQTVGTGQVCLTTKHFYFHSPQKSLKIPYSKIISVDAFSNGLEIQKDGAREKPMFFSNISSWFCYNVIANLR